MQIQVEARRHHVRVVGHLSLRGRLAMALRTAAGPHVGAEEAPADMAPGRPGGALDRPDGCGLRRTRRQRREGLPAGPGREGRRHAARARPGERQGTLDLRLRRAGQLHVRRLTHDAHGGWRARLHRRPDGGPARDQHQDAKARLAREHLEGLRRRRRAAALGDRAEPADLRRPADRRAADAGSRRRRLRQADRRGQMEVGCPVRHSRVCDSLDRQGRRRGSAGDDHRRRRPRPQREGRQRQRPRSAKRQGAVDLYETGSASSPFRRPSTPARGACSSRARTAPARR